LRLVRFLKVIARLIETIPLKNLKRGNHET
jgi:hypothetical protein